MVSNLLVRSIGRGNQLIPPCWLPRPIDLFGNISTSQVEILTSEVGVVNFDLMVLKSLNTKYWLVILVVAAAGGFGYLIWDEYISPDPVREFLKFEEEYIAAMTADNVGGKTPQETLDLFTAALAAGDVEGAAQYFMLDDQGSRDKWVKALREIKDKGALDEMVKDLKKTKPDLEGKIDDNDFKFAIFENGILNNLIDMQFNTHSGVWKIEDL